MRLLVFFLLITFSSCAQQTGQIFTFNDIGWTVTLPEGFELLDSSSVALKIAKGKHAVETSTDTKFDGSDRKLLIVAKKNGSNYFVCSLTPFNEEKDGSWQASNQKIREVIYETLSKKLPTVQFDSSKTEEIIDSVVFSKFVTIGKEKGKVVYNSTMLSKLYKGYDFEINYVIVNENIKSEIELMLKQSKFIK